MIVFLGVLGLLVWLAEKYSMDHVLDGLDFATALDKTVVEPGEDFSWTMTINNRKRLMVPDLQMREQIPTGLVFSENGENVAAKSSGDHLSVLYLKGTPEDGVRAEGPFKKRGRYFFRGVSAEAGDFLGLQTALETYPELKEIVVKPAPSGWEELPRLLGGYAGEYVVKRSLFEDPVLIRGFKGIHGPGAPAVHQLGPERQTEPVFGQGAGKYDGSFLYHPPGCGVPGRGTGSRASGAVLFHGPQYL